jgi:uncharacterized protein YgbK (DUF1537 family)
MNRPLLGCIADDFTGATDLANTLVRNGMRTVQTIGVPASAVEADAIVVALKSRTIPPRRGRAVAGRTALAARTRLPPVRLQVLLDLRLHRRRQHRPGGRSAARRAGQRLHDRLPGLPENGRTIFRGHLFVADALLNESGMEHHPLTPMTDANLVRVLQGQSQAKVGLLRYDTVAQGANAVRAHRRCAARA